MFLPRAEQLAFAPVQRKHGAMLDWNHCSAVERVPGKVSGAWIFCGTRVPVKALFENIKNGASVSQFLEWFPGVTKQQAETVLAFTRQSLVVVEQD